MFDLVTKHKLAAQIILFLMTIPFAFFGVDYYFRGGSTDDTVATIGKDKITQAEFDQALRDQQQRARQMMGANFDAAMFDNPEVRFAILDRSSTSTCWPARPRTSASACPTRNCAKRSRRFPRSRRTASSRRNATSRCWRCRT